jgi:hypothetical protein
MAVKTGAKKHTHKYQRLSNGVWACSLGDCTHFMPLNVADMMVGRKSLCWNCDQPFLLDDVSMQSDKPVCVNCNPAYTDFSELLKDKGV